LHTFIIGEALAAEALSRPRSRDQLELNTLIKYTPSGGGYRFMWTTQLMFQVYLSKRPQM
jgi:hypothetical protein